MDVTDTLPDADIWRPLVAELDRWEQSGKHARFWLRDDDAVIPTAALDRLLDLSDALAVPITLAVIPKETGLALARRLDNAPGVSVAVHGWSHENHASPGEKKQELGMHRGADTVLEELRAGNAHISGLYKERFTGLLVPPWNRIDAQLYPHLHGLGFTGVSTFGPEHDLPLPAVNTHVDVIDWKGTRGGRDTAALIADTVHRLQAVFEDAGSIGILTHHLVHDAAAWVYLERLLRLTTRHSACIWTPVTELFQDRRKP